LTVVNKLVSNYDITPIEKGGALEDEKSGLHFSHLFLRGL